MKRKDLLCLMRIFGNAKVIDVLATLRLVAEMGEKLRAKGGE